MNVGDPPTFSILLSPGPEPHGIVSPTFRAYLSSSVQPSGCIFSHHLNLSGNTFTDRPNCLLAMLSLVKLRTKLNHHTSFYKNFIFVTFSPLIYSTKLSSWNESKKCIPIFVSLSSPGEIASHENSPPLLERTRDVLPCCSESATVTLKAWTLEPGCLDWTPNCWAM